MATCSNERAFSCLRRLKTYLRSTTGQARLNHLTLLHVHKHDAEAIDLNAIANEFIQRNNIRRNTFSTEMKK